MTPFRSRRCYIIDAITVAGLSTNTRQVVSTVLSNTEAVTVQTTVVEHEMFLPIPELPNIWTR